MFDHVEDFLGIGKILDDECMSGELQLWQLNESLVLGIFGNIG